MKFLFKDKPLIVLTELATIIGLNEAIILQQLHYFLLKSPMKFEGFTWYKHSFDSWSKQFPFWSHNTIVRAFTRLEKRNYIVSTSKFNSYKTDRRKWYRIDYERLYDEITIQNEYGILPNEMESINQKDVKNEPTLVHSSLRECTLKNKNKEKVKEVMDYLNQKAEKNFKLSVQHEKLIQPLINLGYHFEDFKKVIDLKTVEWKNDAIMTNYLRPSTLFCLNNFLKYHDECEAKLRPKKRKYRPIILDFTAGEN
ncbi:conserved phage C-terminal domain-containing protein [Rummeliibacillus sp. JY-2-4R]